jgi:RHS repeat-associated protein
MTTAAICATREVFAPSSYYRGEQFDSDLALYYLRARYYNPATGRFMSRDPDDHSRRNPNELHKYLYAHGDPINAVDPTGKGDLAEYAWLFVDAMVTTVQVICAEVTVMDAAFYMILGKGPFPDMIKRPCQLVSAAGILEGWLAALAIDTEFSFMGWPNP